MARSSLLGTDDAPREPKGRDTAALGPGDNSDSGSDMMGIADSDDTDPGAPADVGLRDDQSHPLQTPDGLDSTSDAAGTGERRAAGADPGGRDGADIGVDRVFTPSHKGRDAMADDEDPDLGFLDQAEAGDPLDDEGLDDDEAMGVAADEADEVRSTIADARGDPAQRRTRAAGQPPVPGRQPNPEPDPPGTPGRPAQPLPDDPVQDGSEGGEGGEGDMRPGRTAALLRKP